ncbi:LapA family protein [Methylobacterium sp. ID0610]|uniref:LapA family protein n=1 Tax=Methylobacterium carpenticola TaxID=3344827 RepID=UPI0036771658
MIRFLKGLILLPIAVLVVLLAVANRQAVTVSFDPFSQGVPAFSLTVPLYALIFAAVALGIVVGGCGTWLGEGRVRRDRRAKSRELDRLRTETERLRVVANRALPAPASRA